MLTCRDLKELKPLNRLRYLTGDRGLGNIIRWFLVPETERLAPWVHGGELLIVSGAMCHRAGFNLSAIIQEAISLKVAGILLLVGENYIKKISSEVLKVAKEKEFPIMAIPWDVPLVDIQESLGRAIVLREARPTRENALDFLLQGRLSSHEYSQMFLQPLLKNKAKYKALLETITAYFACHGNLLKAAEMLSIHRNTMKYRLEQVEKILDISLGKENDRLKLELALYIERMATAIPLALDGGLR